MVLREKHANELLAELRDSSSHGDFTQLQTAYQRLWDRNDYKSYSKIRRDLFRFVLCWREPLSVNVLTKALQMNSKEEGLKDEPLPELSIRNLCADFVTFDHNNKMGFAHDSARDFVSRLLDEETSNLTLSQNQETHRQVLRFITQIFQSLNPPDDFVRGIAGYCFKFLPYHCQHSVQDALIYDEEWENLFDGICNLYSRIIASLPNIESLRSSRGKTRSFPAMQTLLDALNHSGQFYDGPTLDGPQGNVKWVPTALGYPWKNNVSDGIFEPLRNNRACWGKQALYLERRLNGALNDSTMQVAVMRRDVPVISFLLHGSWYLQGSKAVLDLIEHVMRDTPILLVPYSGANIAMLKLFEHFIDRCAQDVESAARSANLRTQVQSVMRPDLEGESADILAVIERLRLSMRSL